MRGGEMYIPDPNGPYELHPLIDVTKPLRIDPQSLRIFFIRPAGPYTPLPEANPEDQLEQTEETNMSRDQLNEDMATGQEPEEDFALEANFTDPWNVGEEHLTTEDERVEAVETQADETTAELTGDDNVSPADNDEDAAAAIQSAIAEGSVSDNVWDEMGEFGADMVRGIIEDRTVPTEVFVAEAMAKVDEFIKNTKSTYETIGQRTQGLSNDRRNMLGLTIMATIFEIGILASPSADWAAAVMGIDEDNPMKWAGAAALAPARTILPTIMYSRAHMAAEKGNAVESAMLGVFGAMIGAINVVDVAYDSTSPDATLNGQFIKPGGGEMAARAEIDLLGEVNAETQAEIDALQAQINEINAPNGPLNDGTPDNDSPAYASIARYEAQIEAKMTEMTANNTRAGQLNALLLGDEPITFETLYGDEETLSRTMDTVIKASPALLLAGSTYASGYTLKQSRSAYEELTALTAPKAQNDNGAQEEDQPKRYRVQARVIGDAKRIARDETHAQARNELDYLNGRTKTFEVLHTTMINMMQSTYEARVAMLQSLRDKNKLEVNYANARINAMQDQRDDAINFLSTPEGKLLVVDYFKHHLVDQDAPDAEQQYQNLVERVVNKKDMNQLVDEYTSGGATQERKLALG